MDKPYKAIDVAQVIIDYYKEKPFKLTNLVLQKILFFIQWYFLHNNKKPCFEDKIEAWQYGPVVPTIYNRCKLFQANQAIVGNIGDSSSILDNDKEVTNKILEKFMEYNNKPWELVEMSHKDGGCWHSVMNSEDTNRIISNDSIMKDETISIEFNN